MFATIPLPTKIKNRMLTIAARIGAMPCKRGLCRHAVSIRQSVRLSVTFVNSLKTNKHNYLQFFSPSGSHHILVFFQHQTLWQYSDGNPITGASNASGIGTNRESAGYRIDRLLLLCELRTTTSTVDGVVSAQSATCQ